MNKTLRYLIFGLTLLTIVAFLSACGTQPTESNLKQEESTSGSTSESPDTTQKPSTENHHEPATKQQEEQKVATITVYYSDDQLMNLVEEQHKLNYVHLDELLTKVWEALQTPENKSYIVLWEEVKLNKVTLKDHLLTIDLSLPEGLSLGSGGEAMALQSLIQTYGQLEGVEKLQILVDGKKEETLAGHVSIDQPFTKNDVLYRSN